MSKPIQLVFIFSFLLMSVDLPYTVDIFYARFTMHQNEILKNADMIRTSALPTQMNPAELQCLRYYAPLLSKTKIRMDYYAGYDDDIRDAVKDPLEVGAMRAFLLSPCSGPNDQSCGFALYPGHPFLLYKKVQIANANLNLIEIELHDSALTTSDRVFKLKLYNSGILSSCTY